MSIRGAIYTLLSGLESNVWPLKAKQATTATHAVYFVSREPVLSQDGTEMWNVRLRIEVYGDDYDDVETLAQTFSDDLHLKDETAIGAETLHVAYMESESDDYIWSEQKFNITQEYTLKFL